MRNRRRRIDFLTAAGIAAPAGLNAYIPLLTVGLLARFTDLVTLQAPYDIISSDIGLIVITVLLVIELFADAIPGLDSVNDVVQTLVRPATGAFLMLSSDQGVLEMPALLEILIGGGLAGIVHATKALARPVVTVSTAGIGNAGVSTLENFAALGLTLVAILLPVALLIVLVVAFLVGIRWLFRRVSQPRRL
ncbi:MAG: DUF4126 domain-containing protein [Thermomicrobiaceae bacterium]